MAAETLHVVPQESQWAIKHEGRDRPTSQHSSQQEAIEAAKSLASEGDNIVIHDADGTIRENQTYQGSASDEAASTNMRPRDLLSVGARISWGAIFAGVFVAAAIYFLLSFFAVALGVTTVEYLNKETFAIGAAVVSIFSCLVALFVGGFVVSRTTAGENTSEALIYGVVLWAVLFVIPTLLTGAGLGVGFGALSATTNTSPTEMLSADKVAGKLELSKQEKQQYQEMVNDAQAAISDVSPTTVAWVGFATMVLSLFAAIAGSIAGAGPEIIIQQLRARRSGAQA